MRKKRRKQWLSAALAVTMAAGSAVSAGAAGEGTKALFFSEEYKGSVFYEKLMAAKEDSAGKTTMEKTLAIALSQEGYQNYATEGADLEEARENGFLWTGAKRRDNAAGTGNTEYTRWAQRVVMGGGESEQYLDCDWCAIFVSWCLYQADYYTEEKLKKYYYSYCADPRIETEADTWITAFCMEQENVWYTPVSDRKLEAYDFTTYYHTDTDPYEIPYKPGGLIFFSWDGEGRYFDHVGIVIGYDEREHILTYSNGNSDGQVITRRMDLDETEEYRGQPLLKNSGRIMAYGEYDEVRPLEKKEITADVTDITWDKGASSGLRIQTNSASKIGSVKIDGEYLGSNLESNMLLREGKLSIGKSELVDLPTGKHIMMLVFDDGVIEIPLHITDVEHEKARTVLLYGMAPEASSEEGAKELLRILQSERDENVNILIMTGASEEDALPPDCLVGAEDSDPARLRIWKAEGKENGEAYGRMTLLRTVETGSENEKGLNDPDVLKEFIRWSREEYPGEAYDLILRGDGEGPAGGFFADGSQEGESLSLTELAQVFGESRLLLDGKRFELLCFDGPLMGSVETAAALCDAAGAIAASPAEMPGSAALCSALTQALKEDPSLSGFELGRALADAIAAHADSRDAVFSVVDTASFRSRLLPQLSALSDALLQEAKDDKGTYHFYDEIASRKAAYAYAPDRSLDLVDLGSLTAALGCLQTEETSSAEDGGLFWNAYADTAAQIGAILSDHDASGDDVLYTASAAALPKEVTRLRLRRADGSVSPEADEEWTEVLPAGWSIFFPGEEMTGACRYGEAMAELVKALPDQEEKRFLETYTAAAVYYELFGAFGETVSDLARDGYEITGFDSLKANCQEDGRWEAFETLLACLVSSGEFESAEEAQAFFEPVLRCQSGEAVTAEKASVRQVRAKDGSVKGYRLQVSQVSAQSLVHIDFELVMTPSPEEPAVTVSRYSAGGENTVFFPNQSEDCLVLYDADGELHAAQALYLNAQHSQAAFLITVKEAEGLGKEYFLYVSETKTGWQVDGLSDSLQRAGERKYIPMNGSEFASGELYFATLSPSAEALGESRWISSGRLAPVRAELDNWGLTAAEKSPETLGFSYSRRYFLEDVYGSRIEITDRFAQADQAAERGDFLLEEGDSPDPDDKPSEAPSGKPEDKPSEAPSGKPEDKPSEAPSGKPEDIPSEDPAGTPQEQPGPVPATGETPSRWALILLLSALCAAAAAGGKRRRREVFREH